MSEKRDFILGMLMGSAIGAAVALLYAPQAGDDTRNLLKLKANEAKEKAGDLAGGVRTSVSETAEATKARVSDAADTVKTRVSGAADTVKAKVSDAAGTVKESTRDLMERGRHAVESKKAQVAAAVEAGKEAYDQKRVELEAEVQQDMEEETAVAPPSSERGSSGSSPSA